MTALQYSEIHLVTTIYPGLSGVTNQLSQIANSKQFGLFGFTELLPVSDFALRQNSAKTAYIPILKNILASHTSEPPNETIALVMYY